MAQQMQHKEYAGDASLMSRQLIFALRRTLQASKSPEAGNSRGHGESIPLGETTKDSHGLGAVFGDAERSSIDVPPTSRARAAEE